MLAFVSEVEYYLLTGGRMTLSHWVSIWTAFAGALGGGLVVVLSQLFFDWWRRPILKFDLSAKEAMCVDTPYRIHDKITQARYLRVRVNNSGKSTAIACRIFVKKIVKTHPNGSSVVIINDDWIELSWSYGIIEEGTHRTINIANGGSRLGDVAFIVEGHEVVNFASASFPNRIENYFNTPGSYAVDVVVESDNARPAQTTYCFKVEKSWDSMFLI
jgi:hypothetical protein